MIFPWNCLNTARTSFSGTSAWIRIKAIYSFPAGNKACTIRVASSRAIGRTPVTLGFPCFSALRSRCDQISLCSRFFECSLRPDASCLRYETYLGPAGLLRFTIPYWISFSTDLSSGLQPHSGLVDASFLTTTFLSSISKGSLHSIFI